jgi:threonine dehydrogenase-like Zn-dependent dehydrogenase
MRNITLTGGAAPARAYIEELLPDILDGTIQPGKLFDHPVSLEDVFTATAPWPTAKP